MRLAVLLLALAALASAGQVDSLLDRARAAAEAERFSDAIPLYREALRLDPRQYWATVQLAHAYARLGRFQEARKTFARAKKLDPKAQQAYIEEGYAAADAGDEGQAQKDWAALIARDPSSFLGYHHMGASLMRQGRMRMAECYLRQSVRRLEAEPDPSAHHDDLMHSLIALAGVLGGQRRFLEAESVLREGVGKSAGDPPNEAQFLGELAEVVDREGRKAQAEKLFEKGLALCAPKDACFRTARGNLLLAMAAFHRREGEAAKAERALDAAAALYQPFGDVPLLAFPASVQQLADVGQGYAGLGAQAKAEDVYRRIIALRPSMAGNAVLVDAEDKLAGICARTGRTAEARRLYEDALRILKGRAALDPRAAKQKEAVLAGLAGLAGSR